MIMRTGAGPAFPWAPFTAYARCISDRPQTHDWRGSSVIGAARGVYCFHERCNAFRRSRLCNAMAEIENMPVTAPEARQRSGNALAHRLRTGEQHLGIEIALQCNLPAHSAAGHAQRHRPVDADRVAPRLRHRFEPCTAALGEEDVWHARALVLALDALHHAAHVGEREFEVFL